jgi:hypothetical protein
MSDETKEEDALRDSIRSAFPAEKYSGQVTPADGAFTPELDDDEALFKASSGRHWTDLDQCFLHAQPDGFELLTDAAYRAFLAAWLMYSLENMNSENEVRNFVLYAFSITAQRLRALNQDQRQTVRSLLAYFKQRESNRFLRNCAEEGIAILTGWNKTLLPFPGCSGTRLKSAE